MRTWLALLVTLAVGGCVGAFSKEPPCDPETTRFDARLVGFWRAEGLSDSPDDRAILVIGRAKADEPAMRVAIVCLRKRDDVLDGDFQVVQATTIAEKDYAAMKGEPWTILRYEVVDADTVRVLGMDEKKVAADIKAGDVAGKVEEANKDGGIAATIDVPTAQVRAYIERRGDSIWKLDKPLVLKRATVK